MGTLISEFIMCYELCEYLSHEIKFGHGLCEIIWDNIALCSFKSIDF